MPSIFLRFFPSVSYVCTTLALNASLDAVTSTPVAVPDSPKTCPASNLAAAAGL